ncbi:MAG TPA: hypothetical protein DCG24_07875 [Bacteroidetes bacterium]|nr:hypothetical protein [Myxococcales bacterium]MCB0796789.1 hypothetical protein [Chitinophagales bacterium]HAE14136.1 hypothetical protein [Bacteroidota bacterium]HAE34842.1 hypothetical protein [Bacteroidota bacterium]HQU38750.1 hypothetical protein [Chitinophagales bacterium]
MAVTEATIVNSKNVFRKDGSRKFEARAELLSTSTSIYANFNVVGGLVKIPLGKVQNGIIHGVRIACDKVNAFSAVLAYFFRGEVDEIADHAAYGFAADQYENNKKLLGSVSVSLSNPGSSVIDTGSSTGIDLDFLADVDPDDTEANPELQERAIYCYLLAQSGGVAPAVGTKINLEVHYCGW